jgi:hypothetical protein
MPPQMRYEYVSGTVGIGRRAFQPHRRGYAHFTIYNRGGADEYAAIRLVKWKSFPQTEIVHSVKATLIKPSEAHYFPYWAEEFDGTRYWAKVYVTSDNLVPSVEFQIQDDPRTVRSIREVRYFGPEDFRRFELRVRPGGEVPEIEEGVVVANRAQTAPDEGPLPGGLTET